jgi:hypothetical protein
VVSHAGGARCRGDGRTQGLGALLSVRTIVDEYSITRRSDFCDVLWSNLRGYAKAIRQFNNFHAQSSVDPAFLSDEHFLAL